MVTEEQLAEWERTLAGVLNSHLGLHALHRMHSKAESDGSTEESNREGRAALAALVAEVRRLRTMLRLSGQCHDSALCGTLAEAKEAAQRGLRAVRMGLGEE